MEIVADIGSCCRPGSGFLARITFGLSILASPLLAERPVNIPRTRKIAVRAFMHWLRTGVCVPSNFFGFGHFVFPERCKKKCSDFALSTCVKQSGRMDLDVLGVRGRVKAGAMHAVAAMDTSSGSIALVPAPAQRVGELAEMRDVSDTGGRACFGSSPPASHYASSLKRGINDRKHRICQPAGRPEQGAFASSSQRHPNGGCVRPAVDPIIVETR